MASLDARTIKNYVSYFGYSLIVDDFVCVKRERIQIKFCRSKKSRQKKKWAKNPKNFSVKTVHVAYLDSVNNLVFVSTVTYKVLNKMTEDKINHAN